MCPDAVVRNWQTKGKVECKTILNKDLMIKEKHFASLRLPYEHREKVDKYNDKQKIFRHGVKGKCREIDDCFGANLKERSEAIIKSLRVQGIVNQTDRVLQNLDQNLTTTINKENIIEGGRKRRKIDYNDHVYEKVLKDTMEKDIFEITKRHRLLTKQKIKEFFDRNARLLREINREKNNLVVTDTLKNTNSQKRVIDDLSTSTVGDSVPTDIIIQ
eukprot:Awhi_evm1s9969